MTTEQHIDEDVLEQIVGDIEDEFDFDEASDHVVALETGPNGPRYRVRGITEIAQFNDSFATHFSDTDFDTVGGLVTDHFGRVPSASGDTPTGSQEVSAVQIPGTRSAVPAAVDMVQPPAMAVAPAAELP